MLEVRFELDQLLHIFIQLLEDILLGIRCSSLRGLLDLLVLGFLPSADVEVAHELFSSGELVVVFEVFRQAVFVVQFVEALLEFRVVLFFWGRP